MFYFQHLVNIHTIFKLTFLWFQRYCCTRYIYAFHLIHFIQSVNVSFWYCEYNTIKRITFVYFGIKSFVLLKCTLLFFVLKTLMGRSVCVIFFCYRVADPIIFSTPFLVIIEFPIMIVIKFTSCLR